MLTFLPYLLMAFQIAPNVIMGIDAIASEKDSATKKQMAVDALHLASGAAAAVDQKDSSTVNAIQQAISSIIEVVGSTMGLFGKHTQTAVPTAVPITPTVAATTK